MKQIGNPTTLCYYIGPLLSFILGLISLIVTMTETVKTVSCEQISKKQNLYNMRQNTTTNKHST